MKRQTSKKISKFISLLMVAMMVFSAFKAGVIEASATGRGEVITGKHLMLQYGMKKTVDLTDTGVDVTITDDERDKLLEQAEIDAKDYLDNHSQSYTAEQLDWKTNELYNIAVSDLFVQKLGSQLDVEFRFVAEAIEDGEEAAFGVDGQEIKKGALKNSFTEAPFSTVDFESYDMYDEILIKDMNKVMSGKYATPGSNVLDTTGSNPEDGRELITHILLFNMGQMFSSDKSQHSYSENLKRSREDGWDGWHYLLDIGDSLATYDVFGTNNSDGMWSYVQTFNLHLNPAVTYFAGDVKADMIVGAEFDDNGKLTSVSKSLIPTNGKIARRDEPDYLDDVIDRLSKRIDTSEDGVFRFKLVEKSASPSTLPNGSTFKENTEEKLMDVEISGGKIVDVVAYDSLSKYEQLKQSESSGNPVDYRGVFAEFTNSVEPPEKEPEEGKVIVHYEDEESTPLTEDVILTGEVGDEYETEELVFEGYQLKEVEGEVKGVYEAAEKEVTYTYKTADTGSAGSTTDDDSDTKAAGGSKTKGAKTGDDRGFTLIVFMGMLLLCAATAAGIFVRRRGNR